MTGNEARKKFLDYFSKHGHQIVRSSSLVPADDPTLLFVNAGMVQFKRIFTGEENRGYVRATSSQKCVRAGGKHNDLENVGYTARHHTFFEMLGNFSFGDYFKEKAIEFGWDLLTNGYGLPEDKLWVSIYLDDDEADRIWRKNIGVPEHRIVRFGEKDNFWAMGDTGPCGPCSEIHLDRGKKSGCGKPECKLGCDCDRFLEIWNLVFMQFNRDVSGKLTPLPSPSIDTGLGLERIASILQNTQNNFETDLIIPIIHKTEELCEIKLGDSNKSDVAMKVIADHTRAASFLIGDGILPSNEGRGYVLRRIMRRAIRYGRNIGLTAPFLHETAGVVFDIMEPAYPELSKSAAFITNVMKNEELRFSETLDRGLKLLNDTLSDIKAKGSTQVPGKVIFKLYDTYGFPVDIVRDVVRDERMSLDMEGFNKAMDGQRAKSRAAATVASVDNAYKNLSGKGIMPEFAGYDYSAIDAKIILLVKDKQEVFEAVTGDIIEVVTDATPFYGESGGQKGDIGKIVSRNCEITVADTVKDPTGIIIHKCKILSGAIKSGEIASLAVDRPKRDAIARNHTATHILHYALKKISGEHVKQAGSLVEPHRLRFDFTHFSQLDHQTLDKIEAVINEKIRENVRVKTEEMDAEKAFESGATALFEEKYGDRVRVVSIGSFSRELCGGTHTERTGNIGLFKIIEETSVASGVRRIEALTGEAALAYIQQKTGNMKACARLLTVKSDQAPERIQKLLSDQKRLEKQVEQLKENLAACSANSGDQDTKTINGVKVLVKKVSVDKPAGLRNLADQFKDKLKSGIVILGSVAGQKAFLIVGVTKDITSKYNAGDIVRQLAQIIGGSGGGRPDMAQAGGTKPNNMDMALKQAYEVVKSQK
jgi:alanyl-tRNA synthetase